jgi:p21-activated kinase 1
LPKNWQRLVEDNGISKSSQEGDPLSVMEVVKFYQEDGGNVWDGTGHVPASGSSRSPPIPGAVHAAYHGVDKSVDDSLLPTVSAFLCGSPQPPFDCSNQLAFSPPKSSQCFETLQSASPLHLPASYRPAPSLSTSAQSNSGWSNSRRSLPRPPHSMPAVRHLSMSSPSSSTAASFFFHFFFFRARVFFCNLPFLAT